MNDFPHWLRWELRWVILLFGVATNLTWHNSNASFVNGFALGIYCALNFIAGWFTKHAKSEHP